MDAIEAIHGRRSIRDYAPTAVEHDLIETIVWDAVQAPSTPISGAQPWVFNIVEGVERVAECGARALQYAKDHRPDGPGFGWVDRTDFSVFFNAPVIVIISGRADNSQAPAECCRAGQNLMISAHARGLGTCWVGSPTLWVSDPAVRAELGVPPDHQPFAVFTLGYPATTPTGQPRERPLIVWG